MVRLHNWQKRTVLYGFSSIIIFGLIATMISPKANWLAGRAFQKTVGHFYKGPVDFTNAKQRLRALLGEDVALPLSQPQLVIYKSQYRAELYDKDRLIKTYKIAMGGHPQNHKMREGDRKTPEGQYFICTRLDQSQFHLFMGINYPNSSDAENALADHAIDQSIAKSIINADTKKKKPSWDTPLGGAIGIHGGGTSFNWTLGCIAFSNDDIEEVWLATAYWTPIEILP